MDESKVLAKPWPVKVVEALGWVYVALCLLLAVAMAFHVRHGFISGMVEDYAICIIPLLLPVFMVLALRRGRRDLFLVPHTIVLGFLALGPLITGEGLILALPLFAVVVAPIILLFLPTASHWFWEKSGCGRRKMVSGPGVAGVLLPFFFIAVAIGSVDSVPRTSMRAMRLSRNASQLCETIAKNRTRRQAGDAAAVDPSQYTNSTDFVMALCGKSKGLASSLGRHTNVWCVAINPPTGRSSFPTLFTANIRPSDLFKADSEGPAILTCPKKWGGECLGFCEDALIVDYGDCRPNVKRWRNVGVAAFKAEDLSGIGTVMYLTPTGRVDLIFGK